MQDKIKTRDELQVLCKEWREAGKKIGFTSGAFDILHAGHVDYLEKAKTMCDILVVGVNTDASIKKYKGPDRPIVSESHRIQVVAALESIDYVFTFEERRNQKNIEALKPHYYIKAGDYSTDTLTSKEIVEKYGGEVRLIPIKQDVSTTELLEKMSSSNSQSKYIKEEGTGHLESKSVKQSHAAFLDRDGTINKEVHYLHEPDKYELYPNSAEGIKKFQDMGYKIIVITNQPGIGMGYFSKEDFYRVNREMLKQLSQFGILVDKIYFCPHSKSEQCDCRKPGQALIQRGKDELNLDLSRSVIIGDKTGDMETGKQAGMKTILVRTGFKGEDGEFPGEPDAWADDLLMAAEIILSLERRSM
ncbi:HAD-IIIA family hydrolase [candidate division KSB1 bacterium]|nr:HAD-IIIA family hydrolase [candidate division KSB1 bacterium]